MNIRELREKKGLLQKELAILVGVSASALNQYETGKRQPDIETLRRIANSLSVSLDDLVEQDPRPHSTGGVWVPVLGKVAAGMPIAAIEEIIDYEEITTDMANQGEHFGLQIKGDSMEPRMKTGDVVLVHRQPDVESGQLGVVVVNGDEATVKKVIKQDNGIMLVAFNPAYPPRFYSSEDVAKLPVTIIGRVVELRAKF